MDALVEFLFKSLFKYRPIVWENGHLAIGASWPTRIAVLILGALAFAAIVTYVQVRVRGSGDDRRKLIAMRAALLLILVFVLLQPILIVSAAVGRRNVVGVVIDDSRSMRVKDMDNGRSRADVVRSMLGGADSSLFKALNERFTVRLFRVGGNGSRIESLDNVGFDAPNTRLASALEGARQELAGTPLSGLVLVSDGADNAPGKLTETLLSLNARKVPVYTLGLGQPRFPKDIEVSRVEAPHSVLKGAAVIMNVEITQRGFGGNTVKVIAEDSGKIVDMEPVTLPRDGEATTVRVRVPTTTSGPRVFTVRIAPQPGEMVTENNAQPVLVMVRDHREKVLLIGDLDGYEPKFIREALDDDDNLQLVSLIRTSKDRFLRLGVDDTMELADGFPTKREDLFKYKAIVLGSIEAGFFTVDQMRMISDFVSERGGGFLMLGGRKSFAEGGYAKTPLADVLPVELPKGNVEKPAFRYVKVDLTPTGALYPMTQIAPSETASVAQWKKLPELSSVNRILGAKPGAGTLLIGSPKGGTKKEVVLAYQRFGHGRAFAFPVQDSWLWRTQLAAEDETYKSFWRQIIRALVNDVPERVMASTDADQVGPKESFQINADVVDKMYAKVNGASVSATVVAPSGSTALVPLEWSGIRDGEYNATFTPKEEGVHVVRVTAVAGADTVLSDPTFVHVGTPTAEYFGAEQRTPLLRRIAEETGGRYYTPASVATLAKDLVYSRSGSNAPERLDLWDMPILFVLLIALAAAEWMYRRGRGLI